MTVYGELSSLCKYVDEACAENEISVKELLQVLDNYEIRQKIQQVVKAKKNVSSNLQ